MDNQSMSDQPPLARQVRKEPAGLISSLPLARPVQRMPMKMSRLRAIVELFLLIPSGLLGAFIVYLISRRWPVADARWYNLAASLGTGVAILLACMLILRIDGHKLISIGWTRKKLMANIGIGLAALLATYAALLMIMVLLLIFRYDLLFETPAAQKAIENTFPPISVVNVLPIMVFVAFWEEVAFRGFVLTRMYAVLKRWWLTVIVGSGIFAIIHFYQGFPAVAVITTLALVMSILFVWRKSLVPSIIFHLVNNIVILQLIRSVSSTWR